MILMAVGCVDLLVLGAKLAGKDKMLVFPI